MQKSWLIFSTLLLFLLMVFLSLPVFAEEVLDPVPSESISVDSIEDTQDSQETETTVPAPTVAPFDFALLENSSVQAVQRLDQVLQILSGMLFFLGVSSGILFAKVLFDRIRTV